MKNSNLTLNCAADVVNILNYKLDSSEVKKYALFKIVHVNPIERKDKKDLLQIQVNGIRKLHSFVMKPEGILHSVTSCFNCSVHKLCVICETKISIKIEKIEKEKDKIRDDSTVEEEDYEIEKIYDYNSNCEGDNSDCDNDELDQESDDEGDDDSDEIIQEGSIVWVLYRRKYHPARIISLAEVPNNMKKKLKTSKINQLIIKFYNNMKGYTVVDISKCSLLGSDESEDMEKKNSENCEEYISAFKEYKSK